ncbi:magnesium and cobalt transport protein CorA [Micrococcus sp. 2A]|uniref:magnesium and cobalt transport protein CorA n=1 Tax=Micrococcus TaxID=1269 RepID=UPI002614FDB0|nr:magnesium and cobalt transport protein CorA [uncultured Micrococcus sp.]
MTTIDNAVYVDGKRVHTPTSLDDTWESCEREGGMAWLGLYRPSEAELQAVATELHLHELAVEDAVNGGERAKLDHYGDGWFMVLHPARYDDQKELVVIGELSVFTGENFVVTVRHSDEPDLAGIRAALEEHPDRLALGPWQVSFEILDRVVDDYFPVMDGLETDVDQIEDQLFRRNRGVSRRIYKLSRQVIHVQRAIKELPAMVQQMQRSVESATGAKLDGSHAAHVDDDAAVETLRRLRDVHDHVVHLNDKAASLRTVLENALALDSTLASKRLAEQSIAQNEQTKKISSWAAIIFAPQLIGSIYGMNFDHMPELHWFWGYPFALALMLAVAVTLYVLFKRNDWL